MTASAAHFSLARLFNDANDFPWVSLAQMAHVKDENRAFEPEPNLASQMAHVNH